MKLATRMWLLGAVLPALGTALAVVAGGLVFRANLGRDLDRALAAQASSERVSMFDAPGGRPHIHVDPRGLGEDARLTTSMTIYGPDGRAFTSWPHHAPGAWAEEKILPGDPDAPPSYHTRVGEKGRERVLRVTVSRYVGQNYVLEIVATLAHVDRAVRHFYRVTLGVSFGLAVLLFLVHWLHARQLAARVRRLAEHMAALREGKLDADAPADPQRDEIGALSDVVAEATARLREARAAQERLLADAAHELRTPLTLVRTSVDVALRRTRPAAELEDILADVRDEVDRVAKLATRMLDVAAAGQAAWDRAPEDLAELARDAVEAARATAEERRVLVHLDVGRPVTVSVHAGGVRQALDNLLSNALRFAPARTTIEVRVWPLPGGGGAFSVADEGPGIPPAERERVFEPFRRAAPSPGGAGLGLAIVREIAAKHGGRAYVSPTLQGTTVVVELPADRVRAAAVAARG